MSDRDRIIAEAVAYATPVHGRWAIVVYEPGRPMPWRYKTIEDERFTGAIPSDDAIAIATAAIEDKIVEGGGTIELGYWDYVEDCIACRVITEGGDSFTGPYADKLFVYAKALVEQMGDM